jgi:hypothetical protein
VNWSLEGEKNQEGELESAKIKTRLPMNPGTTKFDLGYVSTKGEKAEKAIVTLKF